MSDTNLPKTIVLPPRDQRFHQGVAVGSQVLEAHKALPFPDQNTRVALFYFYAGALAVADHGCETNEDFEPFLMGLALRAPAATSLDDFELRASDDDLKTDLEVTCVKCDGHICDAEDGDTLALLARTAQDHNCDDEED